MLDSVSESILIHAPKEKVFQAFVEQINDWWPRKGKYTYSFAPEGTEMGQISIEPRLGGRFFEIFANGEEYLIGEVLVWQPPDRLQLSWSGRGYKAATVIEVVFEEIETNTRVRLTHSGFLAAGEGDYAESYGIGWNEIITGLASWLEQHER